MQVELLEQLVAEQQRTNQLLEYLCQAAHTNNPRGATETRG